MKQENDWINPLTNWSADPEEAANTLTHGLGFILSLLGAIVMAVLVAHQEDLWLALGCMVFVFSLMAVYALSTLSHSCSTPKLKRLFQILDQAFIYVLIVASYTPISVAYLNTSFGWAFLAVMWTIAAIGFLSKTLLAHRIDKVAVWIYVALGWLPIITAFYLVHLVPHVALWWTLIGGLCYTAGTVFLINDKRVRHFHALWHLFVIAGSSCHFFVVLIFIVPAK